MSDLITVCITTYNRKCNLLVVVKSVLNQSYKNYEIIIVDDCSNDGTEEFVNESILVLDDRIRYFRHSVNKGLALARNKAIFEARGKFFTFVDDDDSWDPCFLSEFVELARDSSERCLYCASRVLGASFGGERYIQAPLKSMLMLGYTPPVASQFYTTSSLVDVGGYDTNITSGVDHDLWISLGAKGYEVRWLNKVLVRTNMVISSERMTYNFEKRLKGVGHSIEVWKEKFSNEYEDGFFFSLTKNYEYNTYKKFLMLGVVGGDLKSLALFFKLPKSLLIKDVCRYFFSRVFGEKFIHPTFYPAVSGHLKKKYISRIYISSSRV